MQCNAVQPDITHPPHTPWNDFAQDRSHFMLERWDDGLFFFCNKVTRLVRLVDAVLVLFGANEWNRSLNMIPALKMRMSID